MDRWTPSELAIEAQAKLDKRELNASAKFGHSPHRDPKGNVVNTAGSSDYVRLRGLREPGYYVLYDD